MENNITVLVGLQWGDEGKGRMVDYLAQDVDFVVRYQGGNNAGHTVVNEFGTFKLHLIPSGIFNPKVINILGPGMVVDIEALSVELSDLEKSGIKTDNIRISDRATITFPYHRLEDNLEEERLGSGAFGSTRRGIAYAYGERYMKKSIQAGELFYPDQLKKRLKGIIEWKNLLLKNVYKSSELIDLNEVINWTEKFGNKIKKYICNTTELLESAASENKKILFEAQLGSLRDIYYGIYPYTTSSCTLASFASAGGGLFNKKIDKSIGVMKAFSSCVGSGPFITEMSDEDAGKLREIAHEYGAATGRPRRIGHFDAVATKYGAMIQGVDEIAITKVDSLSGQKKLLICSDYEIDGNLTKEFQLTPALEKAVPKYVEMDGWDEDITACRHFKDLPENAKKYILKIEEMIGYKIKYISVGPERESLIIKDNHDKNYHQSVYSLWEEFITAYPEYKNKLYTAWYFCDNEKCANDLAELTASGIKRGTTSLLYFYEVENEKMPSAGEFSIITDWNGVAKCIIRNKKVTILPFKDFSEELAFIEGEGDKSLDYWRKAHISFFTRELKDKSLDFNEDRNIVFEEFELIYRA